MSVVKRRASKLDNSNSRVFVRFLSLSSRSLAQLIVLALITWQENASVAAQYILLLSILTPLASLLEFGSRTYFIIQKNISFKDVLLVRLFTIPVIGIGTWIISSFLETNLTITAFLAATITRLIDSVTDISIAPLDRNKSLNIVSLVHLINGISTVIISIILTITGNGLIGILLGSLLGSTLSLIYTLGKLRGSRILGPAGQNIPRVRQSKQIISSGIRFSFFSFCIAFSTSIPTIVLERSSRYTEVVWFALISNTIGVQNTLLNALRQIQIATNKTYKLQKNITISRLEKFLKNKFIIFITLLLLVFLLITSFVSQFSFTYFWPLGIFILTALVIITNHFLSKRLTEHLLRGKYSKLAVIGAVTLSVTLILSVIFMTMSSSIIYALITLLVSFLTAISLFDILD
jgi:hypothetical protein